MCGLGWRDYVILEVLKCAKGLRWNGIGLEFLWGIAGVRGSVCYGLVYSWPTTERRKASLLCLDHSPKYTGTPYTTGAAPLRYRR
jgi:hypothetical protein